LAAPNKGAELPERVELETVRVPALRIPPPPLLDAVLPERVELVTVRVPPEKLEMPPPPRGAVLSERG